MAAPVRWWYRLHLLTEHGDLIEDVTLPSSIANADEAGKAAETFAAESKTNPRYHFARWEVVRIDQTETVVAWGRRP